MMKLALRDGSGSPMRLRFQRASEARSLGAQLAEALDRPLEAQD